jgi:hypothetical protein
MSDLFATGAVDDTANNQEKHNIQKPTHLLVHVIPFELRLVVNKLSTASGTGINVCLKRIAHRLLFLSHGPDRLVWRTIGPVRIGHVYGGKFGVFIGSTACHIY